MEDEFEGKSRDDYLDRVVIVWEMLRELFARLPIVIGLPDLKVEDPGSVEEACSAIQRARDELLLDQPIPATTRAVVTEGALEMLSALLMVSHTELFGFTEWHAELWFRSLRRVKGMCGHANVSLKVIEQQARAAFPDHDRQEPPENQE